MPPDRSDTRAAVATAVAPTAAIFVFGTIYGAIAAGQLGQRWTLFASAIVFSGALQFATARLLTEGAALPVILVAALLLNVRHVLLGAALRPRVGGDARRRAVLAFFMIDESAGLALAADRPAFVLLVSGVMGYVAWIGGTALGVYGSELVSLGSVAQAVFPVLFTGLAAMTVRNRSDAVRTIAAAAITVLAARLFRGSSPVLPAVSAVAVSFFGGDR